MNSKEEHFLRSHRCHDVDHLLSRWRRVAKSARLVCRTLVEADGYPVLALRNRRNMDEPGLYLSTGIHGDEPASVLGLLEWAEDNAEVLAARPVTIFPCLNPWGLVNNRREDQAGRDLNRAFDRSCGEPICAMLDFIESRKFAVAVSLHEDYDAQGAYIYELARPGDYWGDELLSLVEKEVPRHPGNVEGRRATKGVIRRTRGMDRIASQIEGMPEAIYLYLHHARTALTFETPSEFSLYRRVRAHRRFLDGVLKRAAL